VEVRRTQIKELAQFIRKKTENCGSKDKIILMGDLNIDGSEVPEAIAKECEGYEGSPQKDSGNKLIQSEFELKDRPMMQNVHNMTSEQMRDLLPEHHTSQ
jgi:hypothetical protein